MAAHLTSDAATSEQATRGEKVRFQANGSIYEIIISIHGSNTISILFVLINKKKKRKERNRSPKFKKGTMALVFGDKSTKFKSGLSRHRNQIVKMVVVDLYAFLFVDGERKKRSTTFQDSVVYDKRKTGRAHILLPSRIQGDREISDTAWEFFLLELGSFSHSSLRQPSNGGGKQIAANYTFPRLSIQGDP
ncbi:hypothetical protein NC652_038103 [Populus alba x Populus x berolinensis]|nr:hypothetical protein NC652_038103 [Populus alba x Populus x berolinensis]